MGEKKYEGRYTIQFNLQDTPQRKASRILAKQGRHKAQFLTSVILHYEHCTETPNLYQETSINDEELEQRILEILQRRGVDRLQRTEKPPIQQDTNAIPPLGETDGSGMDQEGTMDMDTISAIRNTLLAFEQE